MHTYTLAANQTRTHFSLEREVEKITFFFSISALINKQEKQTYVCTELVLNYPIHTRFREEKRNPLHRTEPHTSYGFFCFDLTLPSKSTSQHHVVCLCVRHTYVLISMGGSGSRRRRRRQAQHKHIRTGLSTHLARELQKKEGKTN